MGSQTHRLEWCIYMPRNTKGGWQHWKLGRAKEGSSVRTCRESAAPLMP